MIDIPNDSARGMRLAAVEDDTNLSPQADVSRGMLLLMIFDPEVDSGEYRCEGVYSTVIDKTEDTFDISLYDISADAGGKIKSNFYI